MTPPRGQIGPPEAALARLQRWAPAGLHDVLRTLERAGGRAVLVGGAVRDAFYDRPSADWDVATSLQPATVAGLFPRVVRAGEKHGTIMVVTGDGPIEVTTFRSEGQYLDGRRPSEVTFHTDLEADLARRDFTINAMAADLSAGRIEDPFGGQGDLRAGVVRCVGVARERFAEDGLRPLRAVRFAAVLGFRLDPDTEAALSATLDTFELVAWERKRDELTKLLGRTQDLGASIGLLRRSGMLASLAPELLVDVDLAPVTRLAGAPWLRFAGWAGQVGVAPSVARLILERWRVATRDARDVEEALSALAQLRVEVPADPEGFRRFAATHGEPAAHTAAVLAATLLGERGLPGRLKKVLAKQPPIRLDQLAVRGEDLMALGLKGPAIGRALEELLDLVLTDPRKNRKSTLLAAANKLSTGSGGDRHP